jgi:hypothetical protein
LYFESLRNRWDLNWDLTLTHLHFKEITLPGMERMEQKMARLCSLEEWKEGVPNESENYEY